MGIRSIEPRRIVASYFCVQALGLMLTHISGLSHVLVLSETEVEVLLETSREAAYRWW